MHPASLNVGIAQLDEAVGEFHRAEEHLEAVRNPVIGRTDLRQRGLARREMAQDSEAAGGEIRGDAHAQDQIQPGVPIVADTVAQARIGVRGIREFVDRGRKRFDTGETPERVLILQQLGIPGVLSLQDIGDKRDRFVDHRGQSDSPSRNTRQSV
jgi:hypothetical protein